MRFCFPLTSLAQIQPRRFNAVALYLLSFENVIIFWKLCRATSCFPSSYNSNPVELVNTMVAYSEEPAQAKRDDR